jgi:hypothetical protein
MYEKLLKNPNLFIGVGQEKNTPLALFASKDKKRLIKSSYVEDYVHWTSRIKDLIQKNGLNIIYVYGYNTKEHLSIRLTFLNTQHVKNIRDEGKTFDIIIGDIKFTNINGLQNVQKVINQIKSRI